MRLAVAASQPQMRGRSVVVPPRLCCQGRNGQRQFPRPRRSSARVPLARSQFDLDNILQSLEIADDLNSMQEKLGGVFQVRACSLTIAIQADASSCLSMSALTAPVSTRTVASIG